MKYQKCTGNVVAPKVLPKPVRGFTSAPVSVLKNSENTIRTVKSSRSDYGKTVAKNKKRTY